MLFGLFSFESSNNPAGGGVPSTSPGSADVSADQLDDRQRAEDRADIVRFLTGETKGFEDLMTRYRHRAYGIALSLTGNHDDAMDAMQKAFIRVHRSLGRFRLDEPFFPWLYRIVRNTALNQRRDEKRHKGEVPLEWVHESDGRPDPLEETVVSDLKRRLWNGIQELPPDMREVFVLYHFQGMKYREIATVCDVPLGTVMSRLHAARTRLRETAGLEEAS
nr:RNA polymerase sigma factor [Candidatus Krumholzibacteria bacterium]